MAMNLLEIQYHLQDYYRNTFPDQKNIKIQEVHSLTEGWESIIYAFKVFDDLQSELPPQRLILRIYPGANASFKSQREFAGMQVLHRLGYPVPQVFHLERKNSPFEKPFLLMEFIEGEIMWPVLDRVMPEQAALLLTQFCELLVQLHALDWQAFIPYDQRSNHQDPYVFVDGFLRYLHQEITRHPDLNPLLPILDWLAARREQVPCTRPAPVHWDYHPANLILRPDGSAVVIDWTQVQVSDLRFDLGWTLLLAGAYGGDEFRGSILSEYQRLAGAPVEQLAFFDVANCVKRLGSVMISLSAGAEQMGMRPEAVENMRRDFPALQRVYDLLVERTGIQITEIETLLAS